MFNLIRFEILKNLKFFKIIGTLLLVAQGSAIYKYSQGRPDDGLAIIGLAGVVLFIAFIFSSIANFSKDINLVDRSMVFMVPKSGFEIITSKFLAIFISGLSLILLTTTLFSGNAIYRDPHFLIALNSGININPIGFILLSIASFSSFLALIFLSIIITKTFLSKLKFKTLVTIVVLFIISKVFDIIFLSHFKDPENINFNIPTSFGISFIGILIVTTITLWICGWLIDNKTDL